MMFLTISLFSKAQTDSMYVSTDVDNVTYSMDFIGAKKKVFDFLSSNNIKIQNQDESKTDLRIKFDLNQNQYKIYDLMITEIGYSTLKKVSTVDNSTKVSEINLELAYLKRQSAAYAEMLKKVDANSTSYLTLWDEQKTLEEKTFTKQRELISLVSKKNKYSVSLDLNDEAAKTENTKVSFVNMPGFEYSMLNIESPKKGISAENYQGYFLKYLFTKGKTYASVGVYKNSKIGQTDTTAFSDMFALSFGQDFYSRHLGRGSKRFFNLYSGYAIGGILATGKSNKSTLLFLAPSIGLEIFKNKYIMIDTKANYFVPLSYNRNLRGFSYNASFNFVF